MAAKPPPGQTLNDRDWKRDGGREIRRGATEHALKRTAKLLATTSARFSGGCISSPHFTLTTGFIPTETRISGTILVLRN